ncbi:MAG: hypothetical protein D6769_00810 [Methanobacteriota archaeon]|nr:MAG: hypothetical protein D6769_00810 [Euryarchaeota archaeon]
MSKVITIRDDVYNKLSKLKKRNNLSFSKLLGMLVDFYEGRKENVGIKSLSGAIDKRDIVRQRLKRVLE